MVITERLECSILIIPEHSQAHTSPRSTPVSYVVLSQGGSRKESQEERGSRSPPFRLPMENWVHGAPVSTFRTDQVSPLIPDPLRKNRLVPVLFSVRWEVPVSLSDLYMPCICLWNLRFPVRFFSALICHEYRHVILCPLLQRFRMGLVEEEDSPSLCPSMVEHEGQNRCL